MELIKNTAMTSTGLLWGKSEDEVYDYRLEVENFLAFFREKGQYLDIEMDEYEATGGVIYITDNVFLDISIEVDRINRLTTVFWGDIKDKFLIDFDPSYQDCEEVAMDILKELNKKFL